MNKVLYQECLTPADQTCTGEPVMLYVTEENNGHAVFIWDEVTGCQLVKWFRFEGRDNAIRWWFYFGRLEPLVLKVLTENRKPEKLT